MKLFDRIEQLNNQEEETQEPEVIWVDKPETPGQKWFREEAERRRDELKRKENNERK